MVIVDIDGLLSWTGLLCAVPPMTEYEVPEELTVMSMLMLSVALGGKENTGGELVADSGAGVLDWVVDVEVEMSIKVLSHLLENRSVEATSELEATKSGIPSNNFTFGWSFFNCWAVIVPKDIERLMIVWEIQWLIYKINRMYGKQLTGSTINYYGNNNKLFLIINKPWQLHVEEPVTIKARGTLNSFGCWITVVNCNDWFDIFIVHWGQIG